MRSILALALALLLVAPGASALLAPLSLSTPRAHGVPDLARHADAIDRAVAFALGWQQPDGGIYEYDFFLQSHEASEALVLLARHARTSPEARELSALLAYWERAQNPDGTFGRGCCVNGYTTRVVEGMLEAGYDPQSLTLQRAIAALRARQSASGGWSDGGAVAAHETARVVETLLLAGVPRDDLAIQRGVAFLLGTRDDASGGFAPVAGWFTTPTVTARALAALDAYSQAPSGSRELVATADVDAALAGALAYLEATLDDKGRWQHQALVNAGIVGPALRYHAARHLDAPAWLVKGVDAMLARQAPGGGLLGASGTGTVNDATYEGFAGLLAWPRPLAADDAIDVRISVNHGGRYQDASATATLLDAAGVPVARAGGENGVVRLTWSDLPSGAYTLRVESPGSLAHDRTLHR